MSNRIEVFYAYAPEDETWVRELEKHLSSLARQGIISTWHPRLLVLFNTWENYKMLRKPTEKRAS